jgi:hypothetical protein
VFFYLLGDRVYNREMKHLLMIGLLSILSLSAWTQVATRKFTKCIAHSHNNTKILTLDFIKQEKGLYIYFHNYGLSDQDPIMLLKDPENWTDAAGIFKCEFSPIEISCAGEDQSKNFKLTRTGEHTAKIDFEMSGRSRVGLELDRSGYPENCILFSEK